MRRLTAILNDTMAKATLAEAYIEASHTLVEFSESHEVFLEDALILEPAS
jgi:hypothetical protein